MGCACSNSRFHLHYRKKLKLPDELNEENVKDLISDQEFSSWLDKEESMRSQYEWVGLSRLIDAYWWTVLVNAIGYIFMAHLNVIVGDPWCTCTNYLASPKEFSVSCSITWHIISVPVGCFWIIVAIYGLKYWSHSQIRIIWNMIGWCNLVTFCKAIAEGAGILIITHNQYNVDVIPFYQVILFWLYTLLLFGIIAFGFYVQYRINDFLYPKEKDFRFVYPSDEDEVISLVKRCYHNSMQLRVVGSQHSQKAAIWGDSDRTDMNSILMSLDNYRDIVSWDENNMRVTVEAGMILGMNATKKWSKYKNGLCHAVDKKGWALPDLGGVIKQAVGGFTMMGCAGGSLVHDYIDAIYSIRIIDGRGNIRTFTKDEHNLDDPFWGVVVSMGLCGVVSQITYQCEPRYNVIGTQVTLTTKQFAAKGDTSQADGVGKVNFRAKENSDPDSVYSLFMKDENKHYKVEYSRFFWYPQTAKSGKKQNWIVLWKAHREVTTQNGNEYAPGIDSAQPQYQKELYPNGEDTELVSKPFWIIADSPIVSNIAQILVYFFYNIFGSAVDPKSQKVSDFVCKLVSFVIGIFVSPKLNEDVANQVFGSTWWQTLPMDQGTDDDKMPFEFTELWVDIEDTTKAINALWDYFETDDNLNHMGTIGWEFYCAKAGNAWIRPSYQQNSFRIDILWFDVETRTPYTFYNTFWEFLIEKGVDFKPHWGKWCPAGEQAFPTAKDPKQRGFASWSDYYKSVFPKYDAFLQLRKEMDPRNIFLTDYWERMLNVEYQPNVVNSMQSLLTANKTKSLYRSLA